MADTTIFCSQCGTSNPSMARFCQKCGAAISQVSVPATTAPPPPLPPLPPLPGQATAPMPVMGVNPYGGFWIRFLALLIDQAVVSVVAVPLAFLILGGAIAAISRLGTDPEPERVLPIILPAILLLVPMLIGINWLYEALLTSGSMQATLGKRALGLKVTDLAGNPIGFGRATGRHFAKIISGMIMNIGYIIAGFTERKQALHDMIAGTLVMKR